MPLLKNKALEKIPPPELLRDDEKVFLCETTNEIFRDYDEFAERTILCNSMVWTCSMTGKTNLTYAEALQSEENARKALNDFPVELRIPVLYIANMSKRNALSEMVNDVYMYIKDRYFVGEIVEICLTGNQFKEYHILQVIAPTKDEIENGSDTNTKFIPPATLFKYDIKSLDNHEQCLFKKTSGNQIRRKKGNFSKDKLKLFLKQYVDINKGHWIIKESAISSFGINKMKFEQIFDGPLPVFKTGKIKQETLIKFLTQNNLTQTQSSQQSHQKNEKVKQKENEQNSAFDVNKELKEWYKPKEDLDLEDQKKLPLTTPVETKIPAKYLGDVLMLLEFVNSFDNILSTKLFFPEGFTLELIEEALFENELTGQFTDLIQMFLNALFKLQEEEANQYSTAIRDNTDFDYDDFQKCENLNIEDATKFATAAVSYCKNFQGLAVADLPLFSLTVTEVLRLHLLTSGAQINFVGSNCRFQQRGGYRSKDDPGLDLCMNDPHIIKYLATHNVIHLPIKYKVKLLNCLVNQLLTYADVRDIVEERITNSRQAKLQLKLALTTERKRQHELGAAKTKLKKSGNENKNDNEVQKLNEDNIDKIYEHEKEIEKLMHDSASNQIFLGYDRAYRKYIKCEGIPGVFIECNPEYVGDCLTELTLQNPTLINASKATIVKHIVKFKNNLHSNDKENNPNGEVNGVHFNPDKSSELYMCSAKPETCPVHSLKNNNKWFFIENQEDLEKLIDSLNVRGIRESELKQTLLEEKDILLKIISNTPGHILNSSIQKSKNYKTYTRKISNNFGYPIDSDPFFVEHDVLLNDILDLETKIFGGNLGSLKVEDRNVWTSMLKKKDYVDFQKIFQLDNINTNTHQHNGSRSSTPDIKLKDPGEYLHHFISKEQLDRYDNRFDGNEKLAIKCLSFALLQISQSIDFKYLKQPLGNIKIKTKKTSSNKKVPANLLEKWQQSLTQSTSFSQIFLHLATFDNCVLWSKSVLSAKCRVCCLQKDAENMLLCDKCDRGYHIYCLKPTLDSVPEGDWFCKACLATKRKTEYLENPPVKKRRKIFRDDSNDEDSNDDLNGDYNKYDSDEEHDDSDEMKYDICTTCSTGGDLLTCHKCPNAYHVECVIPPLRRAPRGKWYCTNCKKKYEKDITKRGIVAHQTNVVINKRRCAARARHKIRRFIKTLQRSSDSDESTNDILTSSRRSLRRVVDARDDLPLHNATLQELLSDIMKHKDAWPFIRPVQKYEVPDYYEIIDKPMDFGTIKYKLNMGEYKCDADIMEDAFLVFENCNTYNNSEAEVYKCGVRIYKYFQKKCQELGLKIPEYLLDVDEV